MRDTSADSDRASIDLDLFQFLDASDVYDDSWRGKTKFQDWHQTVTARENFAFISVFIEQFQGFLYRRRRKIFEICRDHFLSLQKYNVIGGFSLSDRKSTRLNSSHLGISYAV